MDGPLVSRYLTLQGPGFRKAGIISPEGRHRSAAFSGLGSQITFFPGLRRGLSYGAASRL